MRPQNYDIVAFCSSGYEEVLHFSLPSWITSDADNIHVFSDGILDIPLHSKIDIRPNFKPNHNFAVICRQKAEALMKILSEGTDRVIMIDVDCLIIQPLKPIFTQDFDIAATIRNPCHASSRAPYRTVSGGILYCQRSAATISFVNEWIQYQLREPNKVRDEKGLASLLNKHHRLKDIKLLPIPCNIANSFPQQNGIMAIRKWLKTINQNTRVLHFAMGTWRKKDLVQRIMSLTKPST